MNLLVVDLSSVFFPAWHAGADKPVGFAYDATIARVRQAAKHHDRVVVACDSGRCFRHDISPAYKANRAEKDPTMIEQLRRTQETLRADGYCVLSASGFEADDVVATVAAWARAPDRTATVEILSSDKDLAVLTQWPNVAIRSVSTNVVMRGAEVEAKFGVRPDQMRDWLSLVGDASDGVRGVQGVGPKHASRLLREFSTLSGIIEALDAKDADDNPVVKPQSIHAAIFAALRDGSLEEARQLITLRTDVPLPLETILQERAPEPLRADFGADFDDGSAVGDSADPSDSPASQVEAEEVMNVVQGDTVVQERTFAKTEAVEERPKTEAERFLDQVVVPADWSHALEPRGLKDAVWVSRQLHESRLFAGGGNGNGYGSPEQILAVILAGRELGLGAMASLRGINVIKGRVSMSAALMVGLCLARGAEFFDLVESTPSVATYETKRRGGKRATTMAFTIQQADAYGLLKPSRSGEPTNWQKDPENMLRHRCSARLARVVYPDIVSGCYLPDELDEG